MKKRMVFAGALLALITAGSTAAIAAGFGSIYLVGDSISDQGNLSTATSILSGGTFSIPRPDHYYYDYDGPCVTYGCGRFSNGPNYVDDLASALNLPLFPSVFSPFPGSNNFAFGGTRTDYNIVEYDNTKPDQDVWYGAIAPGVWLDHGGIFPAGLFPWTLNTQSAAFLDRGDDASGALCVVASGSNDFRDFLVMAAIAPVDFTSLYLSEYRDNVLQGITSATQAFATRNCPEIVVMNIPNLGVVPSVNAYGSQLASLAARLTGGFNKFSLSPALDTLEGSEGFVAKDVNIIPFDAYSILTNVVKHPGAYGFSNATTPCYTGFVGPLDDGDECENPEDYVFWDQEHLTTAAHAVLANAVLAAASLDMLDYLSFQVDALDVSASVKKDLDDPLGSAMKVLSDGDSDNDAAALDDLDEFIALVGTTAGIPATAAASMTMRAQRVQHTVQAGL